MVRVRRVNPREDQFQVDVPGGKRYTVSKYQRLEDFWAEVGIVRVELVRNDLDGAEWWEAHKTFGGKWQCGGEGPTRAAAIEQMRSWRRSEVRVVGLIDLASADIDALLGCELSG